jgi:hypothetical protein
LVPQLALGAPQGSMSPGQEALLAQSGPPAPADIKAKIDRDARMADADDSFIDKVLYWRKPSTQNAEVNPEKETQRLRQNAALGQPPDTGSTPIIEQGKTGWFNSLFGWL